MDIKVTSLKQNGSELEITGSGLDKSYISVLVDGLIAKIITYSYRKIVVSIPQKTRVKSVSVQLHVNERKNIHYIVAGKIHLNSSFILGKPIEIFDSPIHNPVVDDVSSESSASNSSDTSDSSDSSSSKSINSSSSISSPSSQSLISGTTQSTQSQASIPSSVSSLSSESTISGPSQSSQSPISIPSSPSSQSPSSQSIISSPSSQSSDSSSSDSQSTQNLPYVIYRISGEAHWDSTISYNGDAAIQSYDNHPF
jgi:hypothetical protein